MNLPPESKLTKYYQDCIKEIVLAYTDLAVKPGEHPYRYRVEWNARFKGLGGRCSYRRHLIEVSVRAYMDHGIEEIYDTIKHEAAHALEYYVFGTTGHGNNFYIFLDMLGAKRYSKGLSRETRTMHLRLGY